MTGVISDIHGNFPALRAVVDELRRLGVEHTISLGDVCGYYCMINECIDLLRRLQIVNIRGNHDDYIIRNVGCPRSTSANACLDYQRTVLTGVNRRWIEASVDTIQNETYYAVHGGWSDPLDEYINLATLEPLQFQQYRQKVFLSGHTHMQGLKRMGDITYCNPGSVGQPRDGDPRAGFAILADDGTVSVYRVPYDIDEISERMKSAGFADRYYSNLKFGYTIGKKHE